MMVHAEDMVDGAKILVIEDAAEIASLLERGLKEEGFQVTLALNGEFALRRIEEDWDLIILDLMLPDLSGENILDYLTNRLDHPPVLVLSARSQLTDKLDLFRRGCDDYLAKPFALEELVGRVRALLRRSPKSINDEAPYEGLHLDPITHELTTPDGKVTLTPKEFAICRALFRERGGLVSRRQLLHSVWGLANEPRTNFVEVHLANLRKKLSQVGKEDWLQTVRSAGFIFARPQDHGA